MTWPRRMITAAAIVEAGPRDSLGDTRTGAPIISSLVASPPPK